MITDSTFEFEKKRNTPVRYDRDLWVKAVRAVQLVSKIRQIRKERHHRVRLAAQRQTRIKLAHKEIAKQKDLLENKVTARDKAAVKKVVSKKDGAKKRVKVVAMEH